MNHPDVWFQLMHKATLKDNDLVSDLAMAFPLTNPTTLKREISDRASEGNKGFFARTLIFYGLAATFGEDFPHYLNPEELNRLDVYTPQSNGRLLAGVEAGKHFGSPARTPSQVVERVQELFPSHAVSGDDIPALRFANIAQAFTTPNKKTKSGIAACPAKNMTRSIFMGYGNLLGKESFKNNLVEKISQ